ncbi:hypothetical protein CMQ_8248 [Grosmannia clavigera kw1407]|uniref:CFEM domain-containing protein n=1 Tax=Grosmannia clavigera (strain kw1407 / UAMH 11150) TaxID=655863 RepID=F0XL69_GROCL|nr:uncharacterized protein CMQ_8248 [Grosmannia clavigera kw1407]EFX01782.1 hypothetical protein CMQ_8248 [Grosmannia clavigera kw1407]
MISALSFVLALGAAASVQAQAFAQAPAVTPPPCGPCSAAINAVPACASSCILSAAVTQGHCTNGDYGCQCSQSAVIRDAALNCVLGGCGLNGGLGVLGSVSKVCTCVSATGCSPAAATAAI